MIYIYKYTLNTLIYDNYQSKLSVSHLSISRMFMAITLYHATIQPRSVLAFNITGLHRSIRTTHHGPVLDPMTMIISDREADGMQHSARGERS